MRVRPATDPLGLTAPLDACVYLAQSPAYRTFPKAAADLFAVNLAGALRAAEAAADAGAGLFVYASTGTVYRPGFEPLAETAPLRDDHPYALSKSAAEHALALFAAARPGLRVLSVRFFGVFGPGQRGMMVPGIAQRLRTGQAVTLQPRPVSASPDPGEGGLRLSLTYIDDLVQMLVALIERGVAGRVAEPVLNVASPSAASVRDIATGLAAAIGVTPVFARADAPRDGDLVADVSRLRSLIEIPTTPLADALARTAAELVATA